MRNLNLDNQEFNRLSFCKIIDNKLFKTARTGRAVTDETNYFIKKDDKKIITDTIIEFAFLFGTPIEKQ